MYLGFKKLQGEPQQWNEIFQPEEHTYVAV